MLNVNLKYILNIDMKENTTGTNILNPEMPCEEFLAFGWRV